MLYESTRGQCSAITSAEAIKTGLALDGGLYVPSNPVKLTSDQWRDLLGATYQERALSLLSLYLTDFTPEELARCVNGAYNRQKFDALAIAPVVKLSETTYILELWHGPTCAFKDMALQILPYLLTTSVRKTGEDAEIVILVATSGDTGKAALEGFRDVPQTKIIVFYPDEGVSEVQKRQMVTQEGNNVSVVAVKGNFDDAQSGVKNLFGDQAFNDLLAGHGLKLSSANSINWGRLVPQIVYYVSAYLDLVKQGELNEGDPINVVVPTGNFGNILAAFYARRMGLPVNKLICAANANNVLTDFIRTGVYDRNRPLAKTISPSMDILISSNLERLLYELTDHNAAQVRQWMIELKETGRYAVDAATRAQVQDVFWSDFATDAETLATIKEIYALYGYVVDTHTAVGQNVYIKYRQATEDNTPTIIASTASPFKFAVSVVKAILGEGAARSRDEFELLELLAESCRLTIPDGLRGLTTRPIWHTKQVEKDGLKRAVEEFLGM
ncbi:MAG: threonine synthase [Firmicutes bacterium]|nr:threonine synthase [Bacillota bacterium]